MATTAMASSSKAEYAEAAHCFLATQTAVSCSGTSAAFTLTGISSTALLAVGMAVTGTNVATGAVIASVDSTSQVTVSKAHTGTVTAATFTADVFNFLLIKVGPSGTYDSTLTNVGTPSSGTPSSSNVGTDEVSGTGYTSGGFALTNSNPAVSGTTAYWTFTTNPSWTSATFSAVAGVIYNTSKRLGGIANRVIGVFDFGVFLRARSR
jgi:hypothetical protein